MSAIEGLQGGDSAERRRWTLHAQIYGPITRRFFQSAGIGAGMKVLDVGCGTGDITLLLADLVGPRGRVVGIDRDGAALESARTRAAAAGFSQVAFLHGDLRDTPLDSDFDALAGRWVLMDLPDPAEGLRLLAAHVRDGGSVAFQEDDFTRPPAVFPETDLSRQIARWMVASPDGPGPEIETGAKLFKTFLDAGLPAPDLMFETPVGGGPEWPGYEYVAETFRSLLPVLRERTGVECEDIGIESLAERLRGDVVARDAIVRLPAMFGAWTRKTR